MGLEGEGSGGRGGGKWGERGREVGIGYPPVHPLITVAVICIYAQHGEDALKWEDGGHALNSHGNYIVDHGKSWKNHGIVFFYFCGNPIFEFSCN